MVASILLLIFGVLVVYFLPRWQARRHQKLIRENGSQDTLKKFFHHKWLAIRVFIIAGTAFLVHIPVAEQHELYLIRVALFMALAFAYFGLVFTPALNQARGLPAWYVSPSPTASHTDRLIFDKAKREGVSPELLAGHLFKAGTVALILLYILTYII